MAPLPRADRGRGGHRGWLLAAAAAAVAAAPGLWFPFLSDDWMLVESVGKGPLPTSPYNYFRPLYMATFRLDLLLWGPSPFFFHLTNLLLIAATAALVVVVVRRYTGDGPLAALAGLLFALHPYHVENAAWIAVRGDPLHGVLLLLAALAYDRWRERLARDPAPGARRGAWDAAPFAALAFFGGALLAKESAVVFPVFLVALGVLRRDRRPSSAEWVRGLAPVAGLGALHLLVIRPLALGGSARTLTPGAGLAWVKHVYGFCVGALVPVDGEFIAARPALWGAIALGAAAVLAGAAWLGARSLPSGARGSLARFTAGCAVLFGVLLLPGIVGFQERYLFLPVAALCVALAALARAIGPRAGVAAALPIAAAWIGGCGLMWSHWGQAAAASGRLVSDLAEASRVPGVRRIVVANMPFRVRGGSVAGDFRAALALSGGNPVEVRAIAWINYPDARADFLDGPPAEAIGRAGDGSLVRLRLPEAPFCGYVGPGTRARGGTASPDGEVLFGEGDRVRIRAEEGSREGRALYAWVGGRLARIP